MASLFIPLPISITVQGHSLQIEWSAKMGGRETQTISPTDTKSPDRITHLVIPMVKGYISHSAMLWCADHNVTLTFLDKDYLPMQTFYPPSSCFPAMKRMQATMAWEDSYPWVSRWIGQKIDGQLQVLKDVQESVSTMRYSFIREQKTDILHAISEATGSITQIRQDLRSSLFLPKDILRGLEGQAAKQYFSSLSKIPVHWKTSRKPLPDSWSVLGDRSGMDGTSPRHAKTPFQAMLNYGYGVLARRVHVALVGEHVDPDLGFFHEDHNQRHNLVYDVVEPCRPIVDQWAWDHLVQEECKASDFHLVYEGHVLLSSYVAQHWVPELDERLAIPVKDLTKQLGKTLRQRLDRNAKSSVKEAVS